MVAFESESKFSILKNASALQMELSDWIREQGYEVNPVKIIDQADAYLDKDLTIYRSGFSLRQRFICGQLYMITLKTLDRLDDHGLMRIEEEAKTFPELVKLVSRKLRSIYQDPADEAVLNLLSESADLRPVVILFTHREKFMVKKEKKSCEISFDTVSYLYPKTSLPIRELEIEGPRDFDNIRKHVIDKYGHGRWKTVEKSASSKFEGGLEIGGLI
jgi:inorganic triphosphatase YgiF